MGNRKANLCIILILEESGELDVVVALEAPCQMKAICVKSTNTLEVLIQWKWENVILLFKKEIEGCRGGRVGDRENKEAKGFAKSYISEVV